MNSKKDPKMWSIEEIETAAIAEMLRTLLSLEDSDEPTGLFPRKRIASKLRGIYKKYKELFCQTLRWYTYKRVI
jgi:hypothetical protein